MAFCTLQNVLVIFILVKLQTIVGESQSEKDACEDDIVRKIEPGVTLVAFLNVQNNVFFIFVLV